MATINAEGSSILVASETLMRFKANAVSLEHGGVSVTTSKGMSVQVSCVTVAPASNSWTEFEVTDVDGSIHVAAHKGDVTITRGPAIGASTKPTAPAQAATLHEGQEATRNEVEECGTAKRPASPTGGTIFDSPYVRWGAIGVGGAAPLCILFCFGGHPPSPSDPAGSSKP